MTRADYVGPNACADCHPTEYGKWTQSLHRRMNQRAEDPGAMIGADGKLDYRGTHLEVHGRDMTIGRAHYKITRTIGVRGLQEYVGIADGSSTEVRLPFAWWPARAGWYPQPYFDAWLDEQTFDAAAPVTDPWAERCPWCHSTYPFAQRIARASAHPVGHGLEQFYASAPQSDALRIDEQVTTGISCESCHLGGRAHAHDPTGAPMHFVPAGATARANAGAPLASTFAIEARQVAIVNTVCAQCHSGPTPHWADGSAVRNSSEALDLAGSKCTARCIDCHDPHRADARSETPRALAACTSCHADLPKQHAGKGHANVDCLDCHMPKVVLGIDTMVRSHRIGIPDAHAAPNACGVCHLDTDGTGAKWMAGPAALKVVAAFAYARAGDRAHIAPALVDPTAYVRAFATFAYERVLGRTLRADEYDPRSPSLAHLPR